LKDEITKMSNKEDLCWFASDYTDKACYRADKWPLEPSVEPTLCLITVRAVRSMSMSGPVHIRLIMVESKDTDTKLDFSNSLHVEGLAVHYRSALTHAFETKKWGTKI
jgi:hypothetical protein